MLKKLSQWQNTLSVSLTLVLLSLSAWILGQMVWMVQTESSITSQWTPEQGARPTDRHQLDLSSLQKGVLFGEYSESAPEVVVQKVVEAPKTRLNLTLVGVVASNDASKNLAVIANRGSQATYGINETIDGTRAKLKAVLPDRVIIDNSGRDETLMLEGIDYSKRSTVAQRSSVRSSEPSQDKLASIREAILNNPQDIFQYVRLSQVKEEGRIVGYRVSPGKDAALFESVGLENGDIAIEFNGFDLTRPDVMNDLARAVSDMTEINLSVLRDGQQHDIYIQL